MGYTINDIAKMTGLSRATVSRVINDSEHVKPETRALVLGAIEEMGYVPNMIARGLRTESRIIGVVTQDILNPYYIEALYEIERLCREHGYALLHMNSDNSPEIEEHNIYYLLSMKVRGIIMLANMLDRQTRIVEQAMRSVRMVTMEGVIGGVDSVVSDPQDGMTAMVAHLLSLGHRDFGMAHQSLHSYPTWEREKLFRALLKEQNMDIAEENVFFGQDYMQQIDGAHRENRLPTAIFALNDSSAIKIYRWAREEGVCIPQDLTVVGFDDIQSSELLMPGLSTIHQPIGRLADLATKLLIGRIESESHDEEEAVQRISIGTRFVARGSTAPPRSDPA